MNIQAIILIGGLGTRLAALFPDRPKALVPVGSRVFLDRQLDWLARCGVAGAHLAAGHGAGRLQAWLAGWRPPLPVTISVEPAPLGTGGGLQFAAARIQTDPFLVLNGDSFLPKLDLRGMLDAHGQAAASVTMAVVPVTDAGRYGLVEIDDVQRVRAFREKAAATAGWVNGGVYLAGRGLLAALPPAPPPVSLECDVFPGLAAAGRIRAWTTPPPLLDMGTPDGLRRMSDYFAGVEPAAG